MRSEIVQSREPSIGPPQSENVGRDQSRGKLGLIKIMHRYASERAPKNIKLFKMPW